MKPKAIVLGAAAMLAVASLAFALGRQTGRAHRSAQHTTPAGNASEFHSGHGAKLQVEQRDLSKVTIENLAQVEFDQAYRLLRTATPETLASWAKRLESLPTSPRKTAAIATFYKALAQVETKTAVDLALQTRSRDARSTAVSAIEATAPATEMPEIARMLLATDVANSGLGSLISLWSETDPASASAFIDSNATKVDTYNLAPLLNNWAALDPVAAKAWLDRLEPARRDSSVYAGFYSGWLEHDRNAAVQHLIATGSNEQLSSAVGEAAHVLFTDSADAAHAFITQMPNAVLKTAAVERIAALAGGPPEMNPPAVDRVARWLLTLPAEVAESSVGSVVRAWSEENPSAVREWLEQMPMQKRDWLAARVCLSMGAHEPQRVVEAAAKIDDAQLRAETLRTALRQLGSPARVRKVLRKLDLPPARAAEFAGIVASL